MTGKGWLASALVVCSLIVITGCGAEPAAESVETVAVTNPADSELRKGVAGLTATPAAYDGYSMELIGAQLNKSSGDVLKDVQVVGTGLSREAFDDATARGFAFGFKNSSSSEIEKKDVYLSIYVRYVLPEGAGQRESVIPQTEHSVVDDRGEPVDFIYLSNEGDYIDTDYPYGVIIFKTFDDTQSVSLDLNGTLYALDLAELKK